MTTLSSMKTEKTIKKRLETEEVFVESRAQNEDIHLFVGKKDGSGNKAHIIIDGKTGEIRIDDRDQAPEEVVSRIETVLTLKSGKKIRSTREDLEELQENENSKDKKQHSHGVSLGKHSKKIDREFHILIAAGLHYEKINNYDLAADCYEWALKISKKQKELLLHLSFIYDERIARDKQRRRAITCCKIVLKDEPANFDAWFRIALCQQHLRNYKESFETFKNKLLTSLYNIELENSVRGGKLLLFQGSNIKNIGDINTAIDYFRKAISIFNKFSEKGNEEAIFWLADAEKNLQLAINK